MCDPVTALVVGTAVNVAGKIDAAEDAEDAYHANSKISEANAEHRREVAEYNAAIFRDQAARVRNEMVGRLNEVAGINIARTQDDADTNTRRIEEALGINTGRFSTSANIDKIRLNEDYKQFAEELNLDADRDIGRITEIANETVSRLGRRAADTATTGFQVENDLREQVAQDVSSQRSVYAAGNVVVSSGTPMSMQIDTLQRGEVQAQRIRRDYRIQVRDLKDNASDVMRDAFFKIEDINTNVDRSIADAGRDTFRAVVDINRTTAMKLDDLYREAGYKTEDINRETDLRINDLSRNLGYDLSDTEFEAKKLDQQANLTLLQGDAEFEAGMNISKAQADAGDDAYTGGLISAAGSLAGGVSNIWYANNSAANQAPVTESQPVFVR